MPHNLAEGGLAAGHWQQQGWVWVPSAPAAQLQNASPGHQAIQQVRPFRAGLYNSAQGTQGEASQYVNGAQRFAPTETAATHLHSNATPFAAPNMLVSTGVQQGHYVYPPAPPLQ